MAFIPRGDGIGVQVYYRGRREWAGTARTKREAKELHDDKLAAMEARARVKGQETCKSFATRWTEDYAMRAGKPRWADSTVQNNRYALKVFIARWGDVKLAALPDEDGFIPWANTQPAANVKVMRAMFADAKRSKLISENPLTELATEQSKGRTKIEAITEEELDLLGECALKEHGPFGLTACGYFVWQGTVGTRPIAVRHLKPEHVDLARGEVYLVWPGKNVPPRTVLIPPRAVEAVSQMPRRLDSEWLFTTSTGKRLSKANEFYIWKGVRSRFEAALPPERARQLRDARPDRGAMDLYELRHCAATSLRRRGATWEEIAWQLGQTDKGVQAQKVYSHLTDEDHIGRLRTLYGRNVTPIRRADSEAANG
jgi:site-specific recombinase XerD